MMEDCIAINILWIVILTWKYMLSELVSVRDHQTTGIIRHILNICVGKCMLRIPCCILLLFSCSVVCNSPLFMDWSMPGFPVLHYLPVCSNSCPLSQRCHPTISSSVAHFSSCPQPFPASGSFLRSRLIASSGQSIGASVSASVLPMNIQGWFPLGLIGLIPLLSEGLSRVFSSTPVHKHQFFGSQLSSHPVSHPYMTTGKTIALTRQTFVVKVMSLLFNMLSRLEKSLK